MSAKAFSTFSALERLTRNFRHLRGFYTIMALAESARNPALLAILFAALVSSAGVGQAQEIGSGATSAGVVLGDPSGITVQRAFGSSEALDLAFGPDYFGSPRLQIDYIWQFHVFGSKLIGEYAGTGLAVAFAKGINAFYTHEPHLESFAASEDNKFDVGGRAIFGLTVTPAASAFEFFLESGPLIPAGHIFDIDFDGAVGFRYRL